MSESDDRRDQVPDGDRDQRVEGYWHQIAIERDPEREREREAMIAAASQRRRERAAAVAARGRGSAYERFGRQLRGRAVAFAATIAILVLGLAVTLVIITQQKASLPAWVPIFGEDFFHIEGEFETAQAVIPGQGQAVMIAGIEVGQIESVRVEEGHAVVGLNVEPKYAPVIRADARLLTRPKTNLMDMVIEVDPGVAEEPIADEATIPMSRTQPNSNPEDLWARLDAETRDYLTLLLHDGAEGLAGRSRELSQGLRRLAPFTRHIARLNGALEGRREAIARAIHGFRLLSEELARHDVEIGRFVSESASALGGFADQQEAIRAALRELPPTLRTTRSALERANTLSTELEPTLTELIPQAQALDPALEATAGLFRGTTDTFREQLRPFVRQVRPITRHTLQLSEPFADTVEQFGRAIDSLNYGFNELAYNPGAQKPGYLFYLPWLNHNFNAGDSIQDGGGPLRRGLVMLSCRATYLASGAVLTRPFLNTLYQTTNAPTREEIC